MSWLVVPDALYARLEVEAKRDGVNVDAYCESTLRSVGVAIPFDGAPFKVHRASDLAKIQLASARPEPETPEDPALN